MRVRKLKNGDMIEVGDKIKVEHRGWGVQWETIHRVTPKFAFVKYNDVAEGKYRRVYSEFTFSPIPSQLWNSTSYSAWRPLESEKRDEEITA